MKGHIEDEERDPWLAPTESCESDETEVEDAKPFGAAPGLLNPLVEEARVPEVQTHEEHGAVQWDRQRDNQRRAARSDPPLNPELERWDQREGKLQTAWRDLST